MHTLSIRTDPSHAAAAPATQAAGAARHSELLATEELQRVVSAAIPDARRLGLAAYPQREILSGYRAGQALPTGLASLTRIGDRKGDMVLAVGLTWDGRQGRITQATTLKARGDLYGLKAFQHNEARFLGQFSGRRPRDGFQNVDAITGATPICEALQGAIGAEARVLESYFRDPGLMKELVGHSVAVDICTQEWAANAPAATPTPRQRNLGLLAGAFLIGVVITLLATSPAALRIPRPLRAAAILLGAVLMLSLAAAAAQTLLGAGGNVPPVVDPVSSGPAAGDQAHSEPAAVAANGPQRGAHDLSGDGPRAQMPSDPVAASAGSPGRMQDAVGKLGAAVRWRYAADCAMVGLFLVAAYGHIKRKRRLRYVTLGVSLLLLGFTWGHLLSVKHLSDLLREGADGWAALASGAPDGGGGVDLAYIGQRAIWYLPFLLAVAGALLVGRLWCGWICPFGALSEFLGKLTSRKWQIRIPPRLDRWMRMGKYALLLTVPLVVAVTWNEKLLAFEPFQDVLRLRFIEPGFPIWRLAWIAAVVVAGLFSVRFYCRYLCPVGAALGWVARRSRGRRPTPRGCRACGKCSIECIGTSRDAAPPELHCDECLQCGQCDECPRFAPANTPDQARR